MCSARRPDPAGRVRAGAFQPRAAPLPGGPAAAVAVVCRELAVFCLPLLVPAAVVLGVSVWWGWPVPVVLAGTVLLLWLSFAVHECGHVLALRWLARTPAAGGPVPAVFVVDRTGPAVHRPALRQRWREALVVLAGPMLPVLVWGAGLAAILIIRGVAGGGPAGGGAAAAVVWTGVVAWGHPAALLAPVGDGAALWHLWRHR